jgi:hypothetical protein
MTLQSGILKRTADAKQNTRALSAEYLLLGGVLLVALVHGLIYLFIMPPWQHYDEPTHFEYAWLIANHPGLPKPGDYDQSMRREVALSMIEHGFFRDGNINIDLNAQEQPIQIGYPQLDDPPFYYLLVSLPLRLAKSWNVTQQLYLGRFVSLILFLVTIFAAWGIGKEITPPGNQLRWILPATVALVPAFADLMTSVNDDVGAIALFSLFLWGSVRIMKRGFSFFGLWWVVVTAALCYFTKSTVYLSLALLPLVFLAAILSRSRPWMAWSALAIMLFFGLFAVVSWGDAANWYRSTDQEGPTRIQNSKATLGEHVFQLEAYAGVSPSWNQPLYQPIPQKTVQELRGKTITLGAWIWASQPADVPTPQLRDGKRSYGQSITVSSAPKFYAFHVEIPEDIGRLWITIDPGADNSGKNMRLYYDGLVLADGAYPVDRSPVFYDSAADRGEWGGVGFVNLLRNPSAEFAGLRIRTWFDDLGTKIFPLYNRPSFFLSYLTDWIGVNWHYKAVGARLFRTFWGKFGWGDISLMGHKPYRVILIFTLAGILGALFGIPRFRSSLPGNVLFVFFLAILGIFLLAFFRGANHITTNWFYLPVARYIYPAIIPTILVLCIGWWEILRGAGQVFRLPKWGQYGLYFGLFLFLDIFSLISIYRFCRLI